MTRLASWGLPRLLLVALGLSLLVVILLAGATSTTAFGAYTETWEGASELRQLGDRTDTPTDIVRNVTAYPANGSGTLAIVLSPDRPYSPAERQQLSRFIQSGGTLLVAEDFGRHSNALLAGVGAQSRVDGRLVRDERHYAQSPAMPVATNLTSHPLTNDSDTLTLNHGTVLDPAENATVIAHTSEFAYLDANRNAALDDNETLARYPVVAIEPVGAGRVILVSDPSLFINTMLERDGNRAFARALFVAPERVLIDTSHAAGQLPPLRLGLLVLRDTPVLAIVLGSLAILVIGLWDRGRLPAITWPGGARRRPQPVLSRERLIAGVSARHPEWDRERIERVVQALIVENEPEEDND